MESIPCKNNLFNFLENFKNGNISFQKNNLTKVIKEYLISDDVPTPNEKIEIEKNIKKSKILLFNTLILADLQTESTYLIIGFEKTILIVEKTSIFLENLLSNNFEPSVCFFRNSKDILIKSFKIQNPEIKYDNSFERDISYLNQKCKLCDSYKNFSKIWKSILPCITGYFIQKSYLKLSKNRFKDFDPSDYKKDTNYTIIDEDDYIELYSIGSGTFIAMLIYHITPTVTYI